MFYHAIKFTTYLHFVNCCGVESPFKIRTRFCYYCIDISILSSSSSFFFLYHFPSCQDDILPGTRSISALKRLVKSNCQAALFDGAVSPAHLSLKVKDCCQSQIREFRGADLHDMSLSPGAGRLTCPIQACLKTYAVCLVSNATNRTYICGLRGS